MPTLKLNQMLIITGDWRLVTTILIARLLVHLEWIKRTSKIGKKLFRNSSRMRQSTIIMSF